MAQAGTRRDLAAEDQEWLRVRDYLREHRFGLSVRASEELYAGVARFAGTPLLTSPLWCPAQPVPLSRIALDLDSAAEPFPDRIAARYSDAVARLSAPTVFENRRTYRLLAANLVDSRPRLSFGLGHYFDGIDTGESVAHEFASSTLGGMRELPQRDAIGSPVDPLGRPTNVAISTLTIRHDHTNGDARFLLHWRDPTKVGHAGGLYQVIPVGIFQPATEHPSSLRNDFSLWRCLLRELAEELLGLDEAAADAGPLDYDSWAFAADLSAEQHRGTVRVHCLGMGVDPLTLATDLLVVAVVRAEVFDRVFGDLVALNAEGELVGEQDGRAGVPFTATAVERLTQREPMQAAGAAGLASAWRHRATLLA